MLLRGLAISLAHMPKLPSLPVLPHTVASSVTKYKMRTEHRSQRRRGQPPEGPRATCLHCSPLDISTLPVPNTSKADEHLISARPHGGHTSHCPTERQSHSDSTETFQPVSPKPLLNVPTCCDPDRFCATATALTLDIQMDYISMWVKPGSAG